LKDNAETQRVYPHMAIAAATAVVPAVVATAVEGTLQRVKYIIELAKKAKTNKEKCRRAASMCRNLENAINTFIQVCGININIFENDWEYLIQDIHDLEKLVKQYSQQNLFRRMARATLFERRLEEIDRNIGREIGQLHVIQINEVLRKMNASENLETLRREFKQRWTEEIEVDLFVDGCFVSKPPELSLGWETQRFHNDDVYSRLQRKVDRQKEKLKRVWKAYRREELRKKDVARVSKGKEPLGTDIRDFNLHKEDDEQLCLEWKGELSAERWDQFTIDVVKNRIRISDYFDNELPEYYVWDMTNQTFYKGSGLFML
jgi:hypothetical protein